MKSVEVSRHIDASPEAVASYLTPETIILLEGTFSIHSVEEEHDDVLVEAKAKGVSATFRFEELAAGYRYEQAGEEGPFDEMETTLRYEPKGDGVTVIMTATISLGIRPRALFERIGAWKRKGEMDRALKSLDRAVQNEHNTH